MNNIAKRMEELMVLVDKSLMLTDNDNERLMLACAMMQRTNEIFEKSLENKVENQCIRSWYEY